MELEGKACNTEKRAGHVPGHQLNQRYALSLCLRMAMGLFASNYIMSSACKCHYQLLLQPLKC